MINLNLLTPQVPATMLPVQSQSIVAGQAVHQTTDSFQMAARPSFLSGVAAFQMPPLAFTGTEEAITGHGGMGMPVAIMIAGLALVTAGFTVNFFEKEAARVRLMNMTEPLKGYSDADYWGLHVRIKDSEPFVYWSARHKHWYAQMKVDINDRIEGLRKAHFERNNARFQELVDARVAYDARAERLRGVFGELIPMAIPPMHLPKNAEGRFFSARNPPVLGEQSLKAMARDYEDMTLLLGFYSARYDWAERYFETKKMHWSVAQFIRSGPTKGVLSEERESYYVRLLAEHESDLVGLESAMRRELIGGADLSVDTNAMMVRLNVELNMAKHELGLIKS